MKILIAYSDSHANPERKKKNEYGGIGYYRNIKPSQQIKGHEVRVVGNEISTFGTGTIESQWDNIFKEYDVFWTTYFSHGPSAAAMLYCAQKNGKKVIIDVDDNFLDVLQSNLIYDKFKAGQNDRASLLALLSLCDAITVSTEPLKERLDRHIKSVHNIDKPIFVIPNMNDVDDWQFTPRERDPNKVVIGYSGSNSHQEDLQMMMPALGRVMDRHPNLYFECLGAMEKKLLPVYFKGWSQDAMDRSAQLPVTATFKEYPQYLSTMKWDIGLAPLADSPFTRSKSHIKWLEYSMYEIPTIASRVYPYFMELCGRPTIQDGETGILVQKPGDWESAIEDLVVDAEKRKRIGAAAKAAVLRDWQYKDGPIASVVDEMLESIK